MKLVKNFVLAVLLAFALSISAPAGEIGTPAFAGPTPTPPPQGASGPDEADGIDNGDPDAAGISAETSDYLFYEALAALLSVY